MRRRRNRAGLRGKRCTNVRGVVFADLLEVAELALDDEPRHAVHRVGDVRERAVFPVRVDET